LELSSLAFRTWRLWTKFDAQNDRLFAHREALAEHEYFKQEVSTLTEEAYLVQKATLLDLMHSSKTKEAGPSAAILGAPIPAPRTTLSRIQLPTFTGKYEDWPSFRDLFQSLIGKDASTTQVEKLHYLKACLKGEAELLIRSLPTTSENFERAWKTLVDCYENKRLLVRSYISSFTSLQKLKGESVVDLRKLPRSEKYRRLA